MQKTTIQVLAAIAAGALFSATAAAQCAVPKVPQRVAAWPDVTSLATSQTSTSQTANQAGTSQTRSITGLWLITFYSGGQVVDRGFDTWHDDGTEILNDTPPPATGNVCLGVWEKDGSTYHLKHPSWTFDANGNLNGTATIREQVSVLPGGNNFAGNFTVDVYDLAGNHLLHIAGTISANRITPD